MRVGTDAGHPDGPGDRPPVPLRGNRVKAPASSPASPPGAPPPVRRVAGRPSPECLGSPRAGVVAEWLKAAVC